MGAPSRKKEAKRLGLRAELAGQVVRLPREWQDATNQANPFALDPTASWIDDDGYSSIEHPELAWYAWALIDQDGTVLKAYTRWHLLRMRELLETLRPTLKEFDIEPFSIYETPMDSDWSKTAALGAISEGGSIPAVALVHPEMPHPQQLFGLLMAAAERKEALFAELGEDLCSSRLFQQMAASLITSGNLSSEDAEGMRRLVSHT